MTPRLPTRPVRSLRARLSSLDDLTRCRLFTRSLRRTARRERRRVCSTMHLRRSVLRLLFRGGAARAGRGRSDARSRLAAPVAVRRLDRSTDEEVALCRSDSLLIADQHPAAGRVGARRGDGAHRRDRRTITIGDLDLEGCGFGSHGGTKTARWGAALGLGRGSSSLDIRVAADHRAGHARRVRRRRIGREPPGVVLRGDLGHVDPCRSREEPDVRPLRSPHGPAASFRRDRPDRGGRPRLGMRSLDRAARLIGWDWAATSSAMRASAGLRARDGRGAAREPGAVYELADLVPEPDGAGGRPRHYPTYMWLLYEALISVYGSARPGRSRTRTPRRLGPDPHGPSASASRIGPTCTCRHGRCAATTTSTPATATSPTPTSSPHSPTLHRELAAEQARELGLLDPDGPGSWTHPDLVADAPRRRQGHHSPLPAQPGDTRVDRQTGETPHRARRTRRRHSTSKATAKPPGASSSSSSPPAPPTSTAASSSTSNGSPRPAAKPAPPWTASPASHPTCPARKASSTTPHCAASTTRPCCATSACSRSTASPPPKPTPRSPAAAERRVEKSAHIEDKTITLTDGHDPHRSRSTRAVARVGIGELTDTGDLTLRPNSPASAPTATATRTASTAGTTTTNSPTATTSRPSPSASTATPKTAPASSTAPRTSGPSRPADPDFERLYPRRNDAESINRNLDDTLWLGRAHSIGHARQHLNLLGYALMVNGLALHRHRQRRARPARRLTAQRRARPKPLRRVSVTAGAAEARRSEPGQAPSRARPPRSADARRLRGFLPGILHPPPS